jgi:hypothetical protein
VARENSDAARASTGQCLLSMLVDSGHVCGPFQLSRTLFATFQWLDYRCRPCHNLGVNVKSPRNKNLLSIHGEELSALLASSGDEVEGSRSCPKATYRELLLWLLIWRMMPASSKHLNSLWPLPGGRAELRSAALLSAMLVFFQEGRSPVISTLLRLL